MSNNILFMNPLLDNTYPSSLIMSSKPMRFLHLEYQSKELMREVENDFMSQYKIVAVARISESQSWAFV